MKSEFSEYSYGFALTHGLLKGKPTIQVAPHFPSLVEEGNLGYDVRLDRPSLPLFLQFKLSDYLTRRPAKYWDHYHKPYFRFDITPLTISRQHNLLKDLANKGEEVFYVAPLFWQSTDFNRAFRANQIAGRSIWLPVGKLPKLNDDDPHHITFTGATDPSWHTEDWDLEGTCVEGDFSWQQTDERIESRFEKGELRQVTRDYLVELRQMLISILEVTEDSWSIGPQADINEVVRETGYLLTTYFGLEMVILWPASPSQG